MMTRSVSEPGISTCQRVLRVQEARSVKRSAGSCELASASKETRYPLRSDRCRPCAVYRCIMAASSANRQ
jgi:hypothetical protein